MKEQRFEGWVWQGLGVLALMGGALALAGCAEEGPFLQTEQYQTRAGESEMYTGGSCMSVNESMGGGSAPAPGGESTAYSYSYEGTGNGVRFEFADENGEVVEARDYNAAFIASGRRDEVTVVVGDDEMRFVHRGVQKCEPIRDPDPEP
jgi:hypothetical protein